MTKPPEKIDDADVLYWAWSGLVPFGFVGDPKDPIASKIYGLAICQYEHSNEIYRFSCNENWETKQDGLYASVQQAIEQLPNQYKNVVVNWTKFESD